MQQPMRDPAAGVPRELLPHLHLVSKYRYPTLRNMTLDTVMGYLTEAPKIVHDLQPVVWQFIEAPADGTVLLVWQPLDYLGTNFASDGYVWGDAENAFTSEHNGYVIEMWLHRGGYQWPNEPHTAHSRKRYRITQSKNPNAPPTDPSLWIVHYTKADPENIIPSNQLPTQASVQTSLNQRRFLQSQGHLARKEFMLHDKANWPSINLPSSHGGQGLPYAPHMIARQPGATPQMQVGAPPTRNVPDRPQHRRGPSNAMELTVEEEEDVSRGDLLDFMTPRDISKMRYEQHHEWMEEIMSSPFAMKQIVPTDLGLGRKGELEALTSGFFNPPTSVLQDLSVNGTAGKVGRMETGKAEEFTVRAARKVAEMEAELDHLKKRHARRMAKFDKSSSLMTAERRLRTAAIKDDGSSRISQGGDAGNGLVPPSKVDEVVGEVQDAVGKRIVPVSAVECVQEGGLEVKTSSPKNVGMDGLTSTANVNGFTEESIAKGQASTPAQNFIGASPQLEPSDRPEQRESLPPHVTTPQASASPAAAPPATQPAINIERHAMSPAVGTESVVVTPAVPSLDDMDVDVEMAGLVQPDAPAEDQVMDDDGSEWVMVNDIAAQKQISDIPVPSGLTPSEAGPSTIQTGNGATPTPITEITPPQALTESATVVASATPAPASAPGTGAIATTATTMAVSTPTVATAVSTSDATPIFTPTPASDSTPLDGSAVIPGLSLPKTEAKTEPSSPQPPLPPPSLPPSSTQPPTEMTGLVSSAAAITTTGTEFDLEQGDFDAQLDDAGGASLMDFGHHDNADGAGSHDNDHQADLNLEGMDDSAFGQAFHPP